MSQRLAPFAPVPFVIEKDGALMRRFNPITLKAPSREEAEAIVEGVKADYEKKHGVTIPSETASPCERRVYCPAASSAWPTVCP